MKKVLGILVVLVVAMMVANYFRPSHIERRKIIKWYKDPVRTKYEREYVKHWAKIPTEYLPSGLPNDVMYAFAVDSTNSQIGIELMDVRTGKGYWDEPEKIYLDGGGDNEVVDSATNSETLADLGYVAMGTAIISNYPGIVFTRFVRTNDHFSVEGGTNSNITNGVNIEVHGNGNIAKGTNLFVNGNNNEVYGISNSIGKHDFSDDYAITNWSNMTPFAAESYPTVAAYFAVIFGGYSNRILSTAHHSVILWGYGVVVTNSFEFAFGYGEGVYRTKMSTNEWQGVYNRLVSAVGDSEPLSDVMFRAVEGTK